MENPQAIVSLAEVRERVIQQLTAAFANDALSMDELESRLDRVYRAQSVGDTEAIVADLKGPPAATPGSAVVVGVSSRANVVAVDDLTAPRERVVAVFSAQSRRGVWAVPRHLELVAVFSDSVVDLTAATLPGDIIDIHVKVFGASLEIIVPAGLRVVNRVGAYLANVSTDTALDLAPMTEGSPVVRITGYATLGNIEVVAGPTADARRDRDRDRDSGR